MSGKRLIVFERKGGGEQEEWSPLSTPPGPLEAEEGNSSVTPKIAQYQSRRPCGAFHEKARQVKGSQLLFQVGMVKSSIHHIVDRFDDCIRVF